MARITRPPQFSFDDSLVRLDRRQNPVTQTQRGNYQWTWCQASLFRIGQDGPTPVGPTFKQGNAFSLLMFGSDVPHSAWYIATPTAQTTPVKYTRTGVLVRPSTLPPSWAVVNDAGQGTLVDCGFLGAGAPLVQGFPLIEIDLVNDYGEAEEVEFDTFFVRCGFQSPLNNGLQYAQATGSLAAPQRSWVPIVLDRQDYTVAHYTNGNLITQGLTNYVIVGLFDFYAPEP